MTLTSNNTALAKDDTISFFVRRGYTDRARSTLATSWPVAARYLLLRGARLGNKPSGKELRETGRNSSLFGKSRGFRG